MSVTRTNTRDDLPTARQAADLSGTDAYWVRSMRPLHVLVFLLPLIAAYEAGSLLYLTDLDAGVSQGVKAYGLLREFFAVFGVAGYFLPGLAMAVVLIVWHVMTRDRWVIHAGTLLGMAVESVAWMLPLLVLAAVAHQAAAAAGLAATEPLTDQSLGARLTVAIGAGLYEEMLFRLVGLALLHFILRDLIQAPERVAVPLAVTIAALAFAAYHRPELPAQWREFAFLTASGVYLGTVYVLRGFGIAVGAHAMYDVMVLVLLRSA